MDERSSDNNKMEEIMLPGFRFHPTDEELVGFYLKKKVQQRPLSMELIKQLDIYKYDPWDLPKLASTGEKEWYFYCPRDRKYRNSARPNRVTGAGFWKATGTDRPIYSSEGNSNKCIGLKKSLVFYKGRAAKGTKTDWMMHEFRLPSLTDSASSKRFLDKTFPANDSWAICRIFKKTNSTAQRALSQSWVYPVILPETPSISDMPSLDSSSSQLSSENIAKTSLSSQVVQFNHNPDLDLDLQQQASPTAAFSPLDFVSYKPINYNNQTSHGDLNSLFFAPLNNNQITSSPPPKSSSLDVTSMLLNMSSTSSSSALSSSMLIGNHYNINGLSIPLAPHEIMQGNMINHNGDNYQENSQLSKILNVNHVDHDQWGTVRSSVGFPFNLPLPSTMPWDSSYPSENMSSSFSSTKCNT